MMTKLIGESFPVTEVQRFCKNGDCYTITILPKIDSPSGDQFVTEAETVLAPDESGGGCSITSNVTLEYGGVWFKGAIENYMETKARTGFDQWLTLAKLFCQEKLAITSTQETNDNHERFFDAQDVPVDETASVVPDSVSPINTIVSRFKASSTDRESHGLNSYLLKTILQDGNDIEQLTTKMFKVEDDLASARQAWERQQSALKAHVEQLNVKMLKVEDDVAFVKLAWQKQECVVSRRRQSAVLGAGFAAGFAAGVTVGYLYLRAKKQI